MLVPGWSAPSNPLGVKPVRMGDSARAEGGVSALAVLHGGMGNAVPVNIVFWRDFSGYWEYILEDAIFTSPPSPSFGGAALIDKGGHLIWYWVVDHSQC